MGSLFKRAAVRGVAYTLNRRGLVDFGSKLAMDFAADDIADNHPAMGPETPEITPEHGLDPETAEAVADALAQAAEELRSQGVPPDPQSLKMSASYDFDDVASSTALELMQKAAAEANLNGGESKNTETSAARTSDMAALDLKNRPTGYAEAGAGKTELNAPQVAGDMKTAPKPPENSPSGGNSLTADVKSAGLLNLLQRAKAAAITPPNTQHNTLAAATGDMAELEKRNRPIGYAEVSPGGANFQTPASAQIGQETPHPIQPSNSPGGTNSVIEASKAAFVQVFEDTARTVAGMLPEGMPREAKIAHIQRMIGLSTPERLTYINSLHKQAAEEMSFPNLKSEKEESSETKAHEKSESKSEEKKEEKDEKKEESKAAAASLERIAGAVNR